MKHSKIQGVLHTHPWLSQLFVVCINKNLKMRWRGWKTLFVELAFPIVIIGILIGLMGMYERHLRVVALYNRSLIT